MRTQSHIGEGHDILVVFFVSVVDFEIWAIENCPNSRRTAVFYSEKFWALMSPYWVT